MLTKEVFKAVHDRDIASSHIVLCVFCLYWRLVSCISNLLISPSHCIFSFYFTPACASSWCPTVGFFTEGRACHRSKVVAGSAAHLARYLT